MAYKCEIVPCYCHATLRSFWDVAIPLFRIAGPEFLVLTQAACTPSARSAATTASKQATEWKMGPALLAVICKKTNKQNTKQNKPNKFFSATSRHKSQPKLLGTGHRKIRVSRIFPWFVKE